MEGIHHRMKTRLLDIVGLLLASSNPAAFLIVESSLVTRRNAFVSITSATVATVSAFSAPSSSRADDTIISSSSSRPNAEEEEEEFNYETRDRKGNKGAIIREDYWYMLGKTPPRRLDAPLKGDDPQFNAFGSCISSESGGNSCTYVSLNLRSLAYKKYRFGIAEGAKEYQKLGRVLQSVATTSSSDDAWLELEPFFMQESGYPPPPVIDAELKMVLLATGLTTSPNFPGPSRELLVARFYANEAHFAAQEMQAAVETKDRKRALKAWEFGKDSWNSYFQVVNRSIVPKIGDKFQPIE